MGIYSKYYYTNNKKNHIYCSIVEIENNVEISFYINENLIERISGSYGTYNFQKDNIILNIKIKLLGTKLNLYIDDTEIPFPKTKKKDLKTILSNNKIYNEINPSENKIAPIKFKNFIFPFFLLIVGSILFLIVNGKPKYYEIPSFVFLFWGMHRIFNIITSRYFNEEYKNGHLRQWGFIFGIFMAILFTMLINKIF